MVETALTRTQAISAKEKAELWRATDTLRGHIDAAEGLYWVPTDARWAGLKDNATSPAIGKLVDDGMLALERENPILRGVLQQEHGRTSLDQVKLGQLITDLSNLQAEGKMPSTRLMSTLESGCLKHAAVLH